jgi:transposase
MERLSDKEVQVFQLLGAGCSNHEISATFKTSHKTVETYRQNLKKASVTGCQRLGWGRKALGRARPAQVRPVWANSVFSGRIP